MDDRGDGRWQAYGARQSNARSEVSNVGTPTQGQLRGFFGLNRIADLPELQLPILERIQSATETEAGRAAVKEVQVE